LIRCGACCGPAVFFLGVYGSSGEEGPLADDEHVPPRVFSWRTDEQILEFAAAAFEVVDFHIVPLRPDGFRFQSADAAASGARNVGDRRLDHLGNRAADRAARSAGREPTGPVD
jgi:hypothetical protein